MYKAGGELGMYGHSFFNLYVRVTNKLDQL